MKPTNNLSKGGKVSKKMLKGIPSGKITSTSWEDSPSILDHLQEDLSTLERRMSNIDRNADLQHVKNEDLCDYCRFMEESKCVNGKKRSVFFCNLFSPWCALCEKNCLDSTLHPCPEEFRLKRGLEWRPEEITPEDRMGW